MVTELNEAELNELNSSWTQFDQQSARLQALLLGQAIMRNDGLLRSRLIEKLGKTFGQSEEELICVGSRLLGFSGISRSAKHHSITMIIDDMEMELDRIEDDERRAMAAGRPVDSEISDTVLQLGLVPANAWHAFFREMLSSDPPGNGIWRSILADAFERLIRGDKPVLFQPTTRYQRGRPLELDHVKRLAVLHVYFEAGKGKGVNASRRMIAEAIGVGFETLKTWSDALRKNPDDRNAMECARLAGRIGHKFKNRTPAEFENIEQYGSYQGTNNLEIAEGIYWTLLENPIERIRGTLSKNRRKPQR